MRMKVRERDGVGMKGREDRGEVEREGESGLGKERKKEVRGKGG